MPKEDLLMWNVKDGWEPLCEFLKCPVPKIPIPHDNRTGDTKFIEGKSSWNSIAIQVNKIIRTSKKNMRWNLILWNDHSNRSRNISFWIWWNVELLVILHGKRIKQMASWSSKRFGIYLTISCDDYNKYRVCGVIGYLKKSGELHCFYIFICSICSIVMLKTCYGFRLFTFAKSNACQGATTFVATFAILLCNFNFWFVTFKSTSGASKKYYSRFSADFIILNSKSKGSFPNSFHAEALSLSLIPIFSSFTVSCQCCVKSPTNVRLPYIRLYVTYFLYNVPIASFKAL